MQVHSANSNSWTANCQFSLFSKKIPINQIFCIYGWLANQIKLGKRSSIVFSNSLLTFLRSDNDKSVSVEDQTSINVTLLSGIENELPNLKYIGLNHCV
jgi:hypothetical protein